METIIVENFRCFRNKIRIPIKPLTILIGENSSGKSTFLALVHYAQRVTRAVSIPDFNEEPFQLGAYDQIAHYHGGQGKRANHFALGYEFGRIDRRERSGKLETIRLTADFHERASQPSLSKWTAESGAYSIEWLPTEESGSITYSAPSGRYHVQIGNTFRSSIPLHFLLGPPVPEKGPISPEDWTVLRELTDHSLPRFTPTIASAPIRSKPRRTYDPQRDVPSPEGEHVPMLLSNLKSGDPTKWESLEGRLAEFGQASGLMRKLEVKRKGRKPSDPFQIEIVVGSFPFNLLDVGYGVSQVLPILVDTMTSERRTQILLQQPEVHLHPRAQAELGSFLASETKQGKRFVVETHSDYLVDRVLMDIRDKRGPDSKDVQILYFERKEGKVRVRAIDIDENGELIKPPPGYRNFFLQEQRRHLAG